YVRTSSMMLVGMVGMVQITPVLLFALPAGHFVDRFNRKTIVLLASAAMVLLSVMMGFASYFATSFPFASLVTQANEWLAQMAYGMGESKAHFNDPYIPILLFLLLLTGVVRAINQPARQSLMPMLLPSELFPNAVTWNTSLFETSSVLGPMLGGFAIWLVFGSENSKPPLQGTWGLALIYWSNALFQLTQLINFALIKLTPIPQRIEPMTRKSLLAGVRFVVSERVVFGTMTLDLFAVLLGGATSLLQVFAIEILQVGPIGLSWLRAAPALGAITMAIIIAHRPPMKNAGRNMLWAVAGFGLAMIVFGLSTWFWLSIAALFVTGLCDNISVVVRHSLVQLRTPDHMRGRVNAVNSVFISCSNELGTARAGMFGALLGPVAAVVVGGIGTLGVVAAVNAIWPQIRKVKQLSQVQPVAPVEAEVQKEVEGVTR
ncbi:MAG: MFS transporter, partial [Phycisphaerales bacterium]|nr:MFS transporter [Phycisphaerales bacterium]